MLKTIYSPSDGTLITKIKMATEEDITACLNNSVSIRSEWKNTSISKRAEICRNAVTWFIENKIEIAEEISLLMGRPIQYAQGEITGLEERASYMIEIAEENLKDIILKPENENFKRIIRPTPLGTAFIIAPWNYPYLTAINSIIPALMSGNCVILKHAFQTMPCAERFKQAFEAAGLPEGVFQYLHLNHGQTLSTIKNNEVNYVSFTGSVEAGTLIEKTLAGLFKPLALELGGKDAAYVRGDCDVTFAVENLIDGSFFNSGQSCCGIERIYVDEAIYEQFVEEFVEGTKKLSLGHALNQETTLGPMINAKAVEHANTQIQQAIALGAKTHITEADFLATSKAQINVQGHYCPPQVLTQVTHQMNIMSEESFAPIIGIMPVKDDEQAITYINDSAYGLTASLWSKDEEACLKLANDINTGTVFVNRCDYLDPSLPWVGVKHSGRGCSLSHLAYQNLTRPKSIHVKINK